MSARRDMASLFALLGVVLGSVMLAVAVLFEVVGMTLDEVRGIMGGYIVGAGWPAIPPRDGAAPRHATDVSPVVSLAAAASPTDEAAFEGVVAFRHSTEPRFDADLGMVEFFNGRVVGVRFYAD